MEARGIVLHQNARSQITIRNNLPDYANAAAKHDAGSNSESTKQAGGQSADQKPTTGQEPSRSSIGIAAMRRRRRGRDETVGRGAYLPACCFEGERRDAEEKGLGGFTPHTFWSPFPSSTCSVVGTGARIRGGETLKLSGEWADSRCRTADAAAASPAGVHPRSRCDAVQSVDQENGAVNAGVKHRLVSFGWWVTHLVTMARGRRCTVHLMSMYSSSDAAPARTGECHRTVIKKRFLITCQ